MSCYVLRLQQSKYRNLAVIYVNTKELLLAFFDAENKRDWTTYRQFLSPDVVWELHSKHVKTTRGIDNYLAAMMEAYKDSDNTFVCEAPVSYTHLTLPT